MIIISFDQIETGEVLTKCCSDEKEILILNQNGEAARLKIKPNERSIQVLKIN